jgi:hypothetical protein
MVRLMIAVKTTFETSFSNPDSTPQCFDPSTVVSIRKISFFHGYDPNGKVQFKLRQGRKYRLHGRCPNTKCFSLMAAKEQISHLGCEIDVPLLDDFLHPHHSFPKRSYKYDREV